MDGKRKGFAQPKDRHLKRYFEVIGSHNNSSPSTHESGNATAQSANRNQVNSVQGENTNFTSAEQVEEEITNSVEAIVEDNPVVEESVEIPEDEVCNFPVPKQQTQDSSVKSGR